jgi:ADP-dependent NAD(P)H-hydrate dehydratase / NAD(P)H-hydrate epimerase
VKPVLTADEYRRIDKAYTGDLDDAMDRAGFAVALAASRVGAGYGKRVIVLAGTGNNGGDGYVAARYLHQRGVSVSVQTLGPPKTEEAARARATAEKVGVRIGALGRPQRADLIIEALFGGGVRDGVPPEVVPWMSTDIPVVAVDFPTGLDPNSGALADHVFHAMETVTFSTLKTGHVLGNGPDVCGRITVADIGINGGSPSMFIAEQRDTVRPLRDRRTHKWSAGSVLVVGGSRGLGGAAIFAAQSALSFGAGAVAIATPDRAVLASNTVEFPTFSFDDPPTDVGRFDVVIFGSGLAVDDLDGGMKLIIDATKIVVDAGGLQPIVTDSLRGSSKEFILTPHSGEFERIAGRRGGTFAVRALAEKLGGVVLLKGNPTRISDGGLPVLVDTGGPELATIGTGDVLAGMIGALWARGVDPFSSAVTGAYYHGIAAKTLAKSGPVTASDLSIAVRRHAW